MNKIKIIELLNMISRGEEVPKQIRFDNTYWKKIYGEKYVYYTNDYDEDFFLYFFRKNLDFTLNDEVEIIEEDKKIEKIEKLPMHVEYVKVLIDKINEIIDYINKGD